MHDPKRTPNLWVGEPGQQTAAFGTDIGGTISQRLNKHDLQEAIQHQRTPRPIGKRFLAQRRQECAQPAGLTFITPHPDDRQHQGRDEIAIGGSEFKVSGDEPCDVRRVLGRQK
jgi:hypothetical protein